MIKKFKGPKHIHRMRMKETDISKNSNNFKIEFPIKNEDNEETSMP